MYDFEAMLFSQMENFKTEPEIIEFASSLRDTPLFTYLTEEMYQEAVDKAIATLNVSYGESYSVESNIKLKPWFENHYKDLDVTHWDRYKDYLQNQKNFAPAVINGMQENLFKITDLLGDPNGENFIRKGLVIGDVQSGKTANYVGLMNLAVDAGYKLMIVLTGTTNVLREQTQIRIEEGLGIENSRKIKNGVSAIKNLTYEKLIAPSYLTTQYNDFNISSNKTIRQTLKHTNVPIVIVTKKNTNSLKYIYAWLDEFNRKHNHDHIDSSLLLIDDEADYASVDTNDDEDNPTTINANIRKILKLFTKSSYIGFTATPFANIFIDPDSMNEDHGQNLFPSEYIYVLGESKEYLGVQQIFSNMHYQDNDNEDNNGHKHMLIPLKNESVEETYLPLKHKKVSDFENLSPSMKEAIELFFLANTIRDLRGDHTKHRSMLFNISRFSDMHVKIKNVVYEYVERMKKDIRLKSKLPIDEALENETIKNIKKTFMKYYSKLKEGYIFKDILKQLNDSVHRIQVAIINKDHKDVDYFSTDEEQRIIVIGGFSLSRGLTLEGLVISYYRRNSVMYDSLLQMGRWFGYRPNYADLVKIYMSEDVISDFEFIATATKELKEDLDLNSKRGLDPTQFGIKVRSGQAGLIITARNKMRSGKQIVTSVDFSKEIIETLAIDAEDTEINKKNIQIIKELIERNKDKISSSLNSSKRKTIKGLKNITKHEIIRFLKEYSPVQESKFDNDLMIKWLTTNESPILELWDVAFATGSSDKEFDFGNAIYGNSNIRTMLKSKDRQGIYRMNRSRLGSPTDGSYGLTDQQISIVKKINKGKEIIAQKQYFVETIERKPILIIYTVDPLESGTKASLSDQYFPMISIGFPDLGTRKSRPVEYVVNKIYQNTEDIEVQDD